MTPGPAPSEHQDWLTVPAARPSRRAPLGAFLGATDLGELAVPFCRHCGKPMDLDQVRCADCGATEAELRRIAPAGRVVAVTVMHRLDQRYVAARAPYALAEVELDSGHRLVCAAERRDAQVPVTGERVELRLVQVGGSAVPRFRTPPETDHDEQPEGPAS
ncbi:MAG: hypothetical protein JWO46_616 [Nocardioidaceae bacterium]|nr:hypothetical protein [Nocardioidaceae bacterium]